MSKKQTIKNITLLNECIFHFNSFTEKKFLILEKEQFRYQKVISDISGNDIKSHKNEPEQIIKVIRDCFKPNILNIPGYKEIWLAYIEFEFDYEQILTTEGYNPKDINELTFSDVIENMNSWITAFKEKNNVLLV